MEIYSNGIKKDFTLKYIFHVKGKESFILKYSENNNKSKSISSENNKKLEENKIVEINTNDKENEKNDEENNIK